jgi:hypothetical protein
MAKGAKTPVDDIPFCSANPNLHVFRKTVVVIISEGQCLAVVLLSGRPIHKKGQS